MECLIVCEYGINVVIQEHMSEFLYNYKCIKGFLGASGPCTSLLLGEKTKICLGAGKNRMFG